MDELTYERVIGDAAFLAQLKHIPEQIYEPWKKLHPQILKQCEQVNLPLHLANEPVPKELQWIETPMMVEYFTTLKGRWWNYKNRIYITDDNVKWFITTNRYAIVIDENDITAYELEESIDLENENLPELQMKRAAEDEIESMTQTKRNKI